MIPIFTPSDTPVYKQTSRLSNVYNSYIIWLTVFENKISV